MNRFLSAIAACAFFLAATCHMTDAKAEDIGNSLPLDERDLQAEWQDLDEEQAGELTLRNMRGLVRAMHKYDDKHGSLPPAVVPNPDLPPEKRLSGFVLLLPFLDAPDFARDGKEGQRFFNDDLSAMAKSVGETIDLTKAWDDPVNLKAARTLIPALLAPGGGPFRDKNGYAVSHFAFVRGANGKDDGAFNETVGVTFLNGNTPIDDGSVNTFALGQINEELGPWTAAGTATSRHAFHPSDAVTAATFGSRHDGGCYFVNCDSYAYFLDIGKTDANHYYALATRAGYEPIDSSALPRFKYVLEWKRAK